MKLILSSVFVGLSLITTNIYASESQDNGKLDRAYRQTVRDMFNDTNDNLDESQIYSLLIKNMKAETSNSDEIVDLKNFYLNFVDGYPEEYKRIIGEMGSTVGLGLNDISDLSFDMIQSIDSENWLNYIRILKTLPEELIVEMQGRGIECYNLTKDYDVSNYHELVLNISASNYDDLPSVFRELIEYSRSMGADVYTEYCKCLKSGYIALGKFKANSESIDFEDVFKEIESEMLSEQLSGLQETVSSLLETLSELQENTEEKKEI
ncbi:MAG: hypothetical protein AB8G05_05410 [Oligoflexales bacterium]